MSISQSAIFDSMILFGGVAEQRLVFRVLLP